jgi:hypothetical protein
MDGINSVMMRYRGIASIGSTRSISYRGMSEEVSKYSLEPIPPMKLYRWAAGLTKPSLYELHWLKDHGAGWVHDMAAELLEVLDGRS